MRVSEPSIARETTSSIVAPSTDRWCALYGRESTDR
jgi:hypothetical protein